MAAVAVSDPISDAAAAIFTNENAAYSHESSDAGPAAVACAVADRAEAREREAAATRNALALVPRRPKSRRNRSIPRALLRSLLPIGDAPDYVKDNLNVLGGYRREMSLQQALLTIFMWHNETLNIWSHLLAALCFVAFLLALVIMAPNPPTTLQDVREGCWQPQAIADLRIPSADRPAPRWPLLIFDLGAAYTFTISALFHTVLCISKHYYDTWRKMDFTAILVVMFSMFWPFCYYVFGCMEDGHKWFIVYVSVAAGVSLMCLVTCLMPIFQTNAFHALRPLVFALLGAWGIVPVVHAAILYWSVCAVRAAVILSVTQLTLHGIGAVFYGTQFPERMRRSGMVPGAYRHADYFSSHFIFHVLIFLGLVAFHEGTMILYRWRNALGGCSEREQP